MERCSVYEGPGAPSYPEAAAVSDATAARMLAIASTACAAVSPPARTVTAVAVGAPSCMTSSTLRASISRSPTASVTLALNRAAVWDSWPAGLACRSAGSRTVRSELGNISRLPSCLGYVLQRRSRCRSHRCRDRPFDERRIHQDDPAPVHALEDGAGAEDRASQVGDD